MGNKKQSRAGYKTPYRRSPNYNISISQFRSGRYSISKNGPFTYDFYHGVLQSIREFDLSHRDVIRSYQVVIYAWAEDLNREMSATVQMLTAPRFRQDDKSVFETFKEKAQNSFDADSGGSSHSYYIRFMRIVIVAWKDWKEKYDVIKKARSEKQKIGREKSKRERELIAKESKQATIRHKREQNAKLRSAGLILPAKKKKSNRNQKRNWI